MTTPAQRTGCEGELRLGIDILYGDGIETIIPFLCSGGPGAHGATGAKAFKVDMALRRVGTNIVPLLLIGVLLGPVALVGCMGSDDEAEPAVKLFLEAPQGPLVVGESATIALRLEGGPVQAHRAGLAMANTSTDSIAPNLLVEAAFDELEWMNQAPPVPGKTDFEIESLPHEPFLFVRGVVETNQETYWSDELRLVLTPEQPPLAVDVRLHGLPGQSYQYNFHDVRVNITGDPANATQVGFAWSNKSTAKRDPELLRPAQFDDHEILDRTRQSVPGEARFPDWTVPTNTTLHLRAWAEIEGTLHWSNETVLEARSPPVVDMRVSKVDHAVKIEPFILPLPHLASFGPDEIEIRRGETLQWINEDDVVHTASHDANESQFHTGSLAGGVSSQVFRFLVPGEYTYECRVHPETMTGTVVLTE